MPLRSIWSLILALFVCLQAPLLAQREKLSPEDLALVTKRWPDAKKTITGLRYVIEQEGRGEPARTGDLVSLIYKGAHMDGKIFNEYMDKTKPFTFRVGRGEVIDGWDQGVKLMREGTRMTLIVPYELAYGTRGNPPLVPRQSSLIFEMELIKIERGSTPPPPPPEPPKKKRWYQF